MAKAYPIELREKVIDAYDRGVGSCRVLAELFGVSKSMVGKLLTQRRETGSIAPKEYTPGPKRKLSDTQRERLIELAGERPDLTLEELRRRLRLRCGTMTVWRELDRAGFSFKRRPSELASSSATTSSKRGAVGAAA
ncbi:MAG: hypothetical protein AAF916_12080 [Planctomycetota bacterium]